MNETLRTRLLELAKSQTSIEKENLNRSEYEEGVDDGYILLAREILNMHCIKYKINDERL